MTHSPLAFQFNKKLEIQRQESEFKYRPKIIRQYMENGYMVTVLGVGYAEGCSCGQWVKPTKWVDSYEV